LNKWKKKRTVKHRYDITAHIYDMRYAEEQTAKIEAAMKNVSIRRNSLVLDAGCGTGLLFNHIADKAKTVAGLDISRATLLQAKERAKHLANVHLVLADVDHMPFKQDTFSHVFAITVIQNSPNYAETLEEIKRVTNPCAVIVVTGLKKAFSREAFEALLNNAGLEIVTIADGENLRCHVAICAKMNH